MRHVTKVILSIVMLLVATPSMSAVYECRAEWAGYLGTDASNGLFVPDKDYLKKLQLMMRITDGAKTKLERCSFAKSANKVTCDTYEIDVDNTDNNIGMRKLYITSSQYDIQLIAQNNNKINYIENNGRGGITTGSCEAL